METICWDCAYAGQCRKPVNNWIALDTNVIKNCNGEKSYLVISCPMFTVEKSMPCNRPYLGKPIPMSKQEREKRINKSESETLTESVLEYLNFLKRKGYLTEIPEKYQYQDIRKFNGGAHAKKPIKAVNIETGEVRYFEAMEDVSEIGVSKYDLRMVMSGKKKSCNGWIFHRISKPNEAKPFVACNTISGETRHYPSISSAVRDGFDKKAVCSVLKGKRKTHLKCTFEYEDGENEKN